MLSVVWWWPLLLLPAPLLAMRGGGSNPLNRQALNVPLIRRAKSAQADAFKRARLLRLIALALAWCLLLLAACRPYWLGEPTHRTTSGRDLLLAIDVSGSMQEADMLVDGRLASRIDVLKRVAGQFVERRRGDRIGLILFGSEAHLYVPLTFDTDALLELLNDTSTGLAGRLTAIGDAIGVAITTLLDRDAGNRVLILVTDGSNTTGSTEPLQAASVAQQAGVTIYTIGVGTDEKSRGNQLPQDSTAAGSDLNESVLQQIALLTQGRYFRAKDTRTLEEIYQTMDQLEPVDFKSRVHRHTESLIRYPLMIALAILLLLLLTRQPFKPAGHLTS